MHIPRSLQSARPLTKLSALMLATLVLLAAAFAGPYMSDASASSASCNRSQFPTVCTITEPNVNESVFAYPQVQLYTGQHVRFEAGGCTQTGGHGKTWKRFLDPISDSGSLYSGAIWIPGTTGFMLLNNIRNATFTVAQNTPLYAGINDTLGNYGDNGYWGRPGDDGTQNQCKGLPNAWIRVIIS